MAIPLFLLSAGMADTIKRNEKNFFENELVPNAEVWDEDKTKFKDSLCLKHETFKPDLLFDTPPILPKDYIVNPKQGVNSPCGKFLYCNRILPRGDALPVRQGRRRGRVYFTGDVSIPVLAEVDGRSEKPKVWMSLTPSEIMSQRRGVLLATDRVVIGGLGMGWFLNKVCLKPSVTDVIVVERNSHLIDWLRPKIEKAYPATKRASYVVGDVLEFMEMDYDKEETRYLLDIWPSYGEAVNDKTFQKLKDRLPHVWGWGDSVVK